MQAFTRLIEEAEQVQEEEGEGEEGGGEGEGEEGREGNELNQEDPPTMTAIQRACLDLCIQLLNQEIMQSEYESPLVCALAVLGVDQTAWRDSETYPPILSAVIKCARFMVVQKAVHMADPLQEDGYWTSSIIDFEDSGGSRLTPRKSCLYWVDRMMDGFMVRGSKSPMQWMLNLRTYGLKIHYNTTARGHVEWNDSETLLYKGVQFSMAQFRGLVHGVLFEARRIIGELLFCADDRAGDMPVVPWESLRDDATNARPGWNFLQDQRTRFPVNGETWLFDRIGEHEAMRREFERPDSESGVHRKGVNDYMTKLSRFREKLLVLMHITGGQP
ncbi:hypothetical protein P152DRAFT_406735, partial [Eremomyces bilateralis CBS 781.70]